jgi:outer membrane factor, OMF family
MFKVYGVLVSCLSWSMVTAAYAAPVPKKTASVCQNPDLSALKKSLLPEGNSAQPEALPPPNPFQIPQPQQPQSVAIGQTQTLSLPAAISLAFDRNQDFQVTQLQLQRSCAQLKQVRASLYPTLQVSGSISRTDNGSFDPQKRSYSSGAGSQVQQETTAALAQQRAISQQEFQQQLQELQTRFQKSATQVQRNNFQTQLSSLQSRSNSLAVFPNITEISPLTSSDVVPPLVSSNSPGGIGGYFNGSLALTYSIWTGGRRSASLEAAQKQVEYADFEVQRQLQVLRQSVVSNYYNIQQTQALIEVANSAVTNYQESLRTVQLGEVAGTKTKFEVLQAAVTLTDAQQNQTQANTLYTVARRQLVEQLNLPETVDIDLPAESKAVKAEIWSLPLEDSILLGLNHRIELTQTDLQLKIAQRQKRIALSQKQPQLQGFASFDVADDLEDQHLGDYGYRVGVQVSLDVFDGGNVRSQVRQLDATIAQIMQQFAQFKESIRFEVEQAYFSLKANEANIETSNQSLISAEESLRLADLRLKAGVGTAQEVTRAQADLTQAQGNSVAAILGYNRSLEALKKATGYASPEALKP